MSAYIKLSTLEYPRHEGDIRDEYPEIREDQTGDTFPCPSTYAKVEWTDCPDFNPYTQIAYEMPPEHVEGKWKMVWAVRDFTEQELLYQPPPPIINKDTDETTTTN